ncbi:Solute carrier family 35 member G1 [Holothuria leucospilota]|uniref:Solute carrier family 35 member G1 n=1 Tax=Holothuria leucospilota TaxID=206669 RepID=A0A9Q1BVI5_HOLLE|nr:Solute carrier family 35 member G1 [Holothuria leucospilota]
MEEGEVLGNFNCFKRAFLSIYHHRGILMAFAAAFCSVSSTLTVSSLEGAIGPTEVTFMRGLVTATLSLVLLVRRGVRIRPSSLGELKLLVLHSLLGAVGIWTQYYAYQNMATADAAAIIFGYIAFTALFARIFLKEPFGWLEGLLIVLTITGVVFIMQPPFLFGGYGSEKSSTILPALAAFCTCLLGGFQMVALRQLGKQGTDACKTVMYMGIALMVCTAISIASGGPWSVPGCSFTRFLSVLVGLFSFTSFSLLSFALTLENAVVISLITVSQVYLIFIADILFFGAKPDWFSITGTVLIVGSSMANSLKTVFGKKRMSATEDSKHEVDESVEGADTSPSENMESTVIESTI